MAGKGSALDSSLDSSCFGTLQESLDFCIGTLTLGSCLDTTLELSGIADVPRFPSSVCRCFVFEVGAGLFRPFSSFFDDFVVVVRTELLQLVVCLRGGWTTSVVSLFSCWVGDWMVNGDLLVCRLSPPENLVDQI